MGHCLGLGDCGLKGRGSILAMDRRPVFSRIAGSAMGMRALCFELMSM